MAVQSGATVVLATHQLEDVERLADRVAILHGGRFLLDDTLERTRSSVNRLQVAFEGDWPDALGSDPRLIRVERQGRVALLTVDGPAAPVAAAMREAGATVVTEVELRLSDVLEAVLEREGYTRDVVTWNAG